MISKLLQTHKTVFTLQEIQTILEIPTLQGVKSFLRRAKKNNSLIHIRQNIRALPNYDHREVVQKIRKNSYISLETVLYQSGIIFQYYQNITTCISDDSRTYTFDGREYKFCKIKDDILTNPIGIKNFDNYRIAMLERALCDLVYLYPNTTIDNPTGINQTRLKQILPIYPEKTILAVKKLGNAQQN
jgi:hypothetical protein